MQYLAVLACLVVAASAQMFHNGIMGNNMNQIGQMMNQMNQWNQGWTQGNNQANMLQQLLQGQMNGYQQQSGQNMYGQQWGQGGRGQQQQNGMTNNVLGSLLGNILGSVLMSNMRGQMNWDNSGVKEEDMEEMSHMEQLMKMSMTTEMLDLMRAYNKFKDNEEEFGKAMYHLCFMVNATYAASQQYNFEIFNATTDQTGEELERQGMGATEEQKMAGTINLLMTQNDVFEEMFFRIATWSCWAGNEYLQSALKLEKMSKGEKCDH